MAMKIEKTECFWSNLAKCEAIIEAGRVKFAKKCDNNKKSCFQLYRGLGAMASAVEAEIHVVNYFAQILCYKNRESIDIIVILHFYEKSTSRWYEG